MTQNYHTPLTIGAPANAATVNGPLGQLDSAIAGLATNTALLDYVLSTGGPITQANGAASAAQKVVTVDSTTGFLSGCFVEYALATGVIERNTVATVDSATQLTLITNIGTGGIANDALIAVVPVGYYNGKQGVYNVLDYGASSGGAAATNTTAIQAALTAAAVGGGEVYVPAGTYSISATLVMDDYDGVRLRGATGSYAGPGSNYATTLVWAGADSDDMLSMFSAWHCEVDHICFDGADTTGVRVIYIDSDGDRDARSLSLHHLAIRRANVGIQLGTSGAGTQYSMAEMWISETWFAEMQGTTATAIHVQSQNVDMLNVENCSLGNAGDYGIRMVRSGIARLCNVSAGGAVGMTFIAIEGPFHNVNITNCQIESALYFLNVTADAADSYNPILLLQCTVDEAIQITPQCRVTSIANIYNADVTLGDDVQIVSINDYFTGSFAIVEGGSNAKIYELDGENGWSISGSAQIKRVLTATKTWNPGSISTMAYAETTLTVTGAAAGDVCHVALTTLNLAGLLVFATVASTNTLNVTLFNCTGGTLVVGEGTLRGTVWKH